MCLPGSRVISEYAKKSQFKTVVYNLSPGIVIMLSVYICRSVLGHWSLSTAISLQDCVLNFLICFFG